MGMDWLLEHEGDPDIDEVRTDTHRERTTTKHSKTSSTESCTERYSCQSQNNCVAEMWTGPEEGSCLRLLDCCIPQLRLESNKEEEEEDA